MQTLDHKVWFQSREDLNFPRHFIFSDGRMAISFTQGRHTVYERSFFFVSEDQGQTWLTDQAYPFDHHIHFINRLQDGSLLTWGESGLLRERYRKYFEAALSYDEGRSWTLHEMPAECSFHLVQYNRLVELADGTLLQGAYGPNPGAGSRQAHLLARAPGETWWRHRSQIVVAGTNDTWMQKSSEPGSGEPAIALLPDGRIVCVARTGYPDSPLVQAWSEDNGYSWTPVVCLAHSGVSPQLEVFDNGKLLLVFGAREENKLIGAVTALVSDNGGETWSDPYVVYHGPGSSYACVTPTGPDRCLISYSESQFRLPELPQYVAHGALNKICAVTLVVDS